MTDGSFRFDRFSLDPADRRLTCDGRPVEINARYLDALALLVSEAGKLVSKQRFLDEVWRGVPVTDEALTQCVRTLRRQLGDDAARPRFIETVPKHGYRFVAPVESAGERAVVGRRASDGEWRQVLSVAVAGTVGGGLAGLIGGVFYGFAGAAQPLQAGMGAISVLLVIVSLTIMIAVIGAAGVAFGIAGAAFVSRRSGPSIIAGGAIGGMIVGAIVKLLGLDAFMLLIGRSPADITGPLEGVILGAGVGLAVWIASRRGWSGRVRLSVAVAALTGAGAGLLIALLGGVMMGGSLDLLARSFPGSRLRLDRIAALFGEQDFGPATRLATGTFEGALFSACIVAAMVLARRRMAQR